MSKTQQSARRALRELQAFQDAQREPVRRLAARRWPDRAIEAGVAAKLARRLWWFAARILYNSGTVAW